MNYKKIKLNSLIFLLTFSSLSILSCGDTEETNNDDEKTSQNSLAAGTIIESIPCRTNLEHSYAYYLPSSYNTNKVYPLIIAFDAHARGTLAVSKFKQAAEQYGYIVVASNNARNGLQDINPVINSLWEDALGRFSVDNKRVYTAGFSGGARVAASVAIYKGGVKGVIACAGGMPSVGQELTKKFDFLGIVGLNDFNYQEMKTLDKALTENDFTCQLLTFKGGHEWPSSAILSKAIQWLDLMNMKRGELPVDDNLVRNYTLSYADTINELIMVNENYKAYLLYNTLLKDLKGLYDISEYQKSYNELLKNQQVNKGINAEVEVKKTELEKQEVFLEYFKSNKFVAIKAELKPFIRPNALLTSSHKRLLSFIGMLCYIYTESAVNSQNKAAYKGFMEIYELVEPKNPDKEYFKACQAIMDNQKEMAMQHLSTAIDYGYYNAPKLKNIGFFEELRTRPEFDLLVQKAMKNSKK